MSSTDDPASFDRVWDATQVALRRHAFRLDRVDRVGGVITTLPETSQSAGEFWRRDVHTVRDLAESTLSAVRRWAEVRFERTPDGHCAAIEVIVHKERISTPDRQFNNTGAAYAFFGDSLPSTTGLASVTQDPDQWLDLGRDAATEDFLLRQITRRAGVVCTSERSAGVR